MRFMIVLCLLMLAVAVAPVRAQTSEPSSTSCPALVDEALQLTASRCEDIGSRELCYGNLLIDAQPQPGYDDFQLQAPGDIEPVNRVQSLRLSAMDELQSIWGVALMQVEAILTEQDALEAVTFVLFGDVEIDNAVTSQPLTTNAAANIRAEPRTTSSVIGGLVAEESVTATGRTADGAWVRVVLPDDAAQSGWVNADLLALPADEALPIVDPEESFLYGPMQAFYLRSGEDDAPCSEAPDSGIMIQTPEGEAEVTLLMNEANIQLRATAYVQAQPAGEMSLYVLEGSAQVEAEGVTQTAVAGTVVTVPLDENGAVNGAPSEAEPYDETQLAALPLDLLERPVDPAPPLDAAAGLPTAGVWNFSWGADQRQCPNGEIVAFDTENPATAVTVEEDGSAITILLNRYTRTAPGTYQTIFTDATGNLHSYTLTVDRFDLMRGEAQIEYLFGCTLTVPFSLTLSQPG